MFKKHVTTELSAYCNGELPQEAARRVGEHLLVCGRCRSDYDDIKLGVELAARLPEATAPPELWGEIEALLDARPVSAATGKRRTRFAYQFGWRQVAFGAALLLVMFGVAAVWYDARLSRQVEEARRAIGDIKPGGEPLPLPVGPLEAPPEIEKTPLMSPEVAVQPKTDRTEKATARSTTELPGAASWDVARLEGSPRVGATELDGAGKIRVGEWLETDRSSRARITVGSIGHVDVAPNTRIRLVEAKENEHRLALAVGEMHAEIDAPPRIFFVDTPTAQAVDLGCEYTLTVGESGASVLRVQSGWVAFVNRGRESLVPQGALAVTRPGFAPGTPYFASATNRFKEALHRFDFAAGGRPALDVILSESRPVDTLTLWHLLSRVGQGDRARIFEHMVKEVPLPEDVTRAGILRLDKEMLRMWRLDLEVEWYRRR